MKRILMVLVVALVMVAMVAAMAMPAFAAGQTWTTSKTNPSGNTSGGNCAAPGQTCTTSNNGGHVKSVT